MTANREQFGSRLGFILAAAGSAVGIGNLVGFPVNAAKNGGAAFLLLYAFFVVLICLPVMMAELAAGRNSRKNPLGTYRHFAPGSPGWLIGGWLALITPYMIAVFYAVITLWITGYLTAIISGNLQALTDPDYFAHFVSSPTIFVYLIAVAALVGLILHSGVKDGIERGAKIMMPSLFVMLVGLVIFVLTRDHAMAGVQYYLIPDISKINAQVINGAMGQAFFSLSLGMGILITYGSYMDGRSSIPGSAKMVALADTGVAFTAGLMVLPAIFSFNPGIDPGTLSDSSVSLIFTFLPKIFLAMQVSVGYVGASIVAALFFLLVFFAALTSLVSIIEVPVSGVMDQKGYSRNRALATIGITMFFIALACGLSFGMVDFFTNFAHYGEASHSLFDLVYDVFYDTILPLNGFIICLLVTYRWKKANWNAELETGEPNYKGSLLERYSNFALGTFIPVILLFVFVNTVLNKFFNISLI
ncbi:sodium-dependent transporter [Aestuariicella hydrocarbonica]|uniref:Sodium-dependent transporter n=1 Tax=Pseudomaricurvus hydrocarbonicus TaxID=1470433 RepID=A0A9E5JYC6_9GAMM|nr:sodium-dependent transporter [Aestuariicella hydrocarbonica]NHO66915.1 sodium-dependent transporter [Aestuariicella hydrocarbonica]